MQIRRGSTCFSVRIAGFVLIAILLLLMTSARADDNAVPISSLEKWPDRLATPLNHRFVMMGELHGTREGPQAALGLCRLMSHSGRMVLLCLEIPEDEQPIIDEVAKAGNLDPLQKSFFFRNCPDGRSSISEADLILSASREGFPVFAFDISMKDRGEREEMQAVHLDAIAKANPKACLVVLAGNYHTRKDDYKGISATATPSTAQRLVKLGHDIFSISLDSRGGSAWYLSSQGEPPVLIRTRSMEGSSKYLLSFQPYLGHQASLICRRTEFSPPWLGAKATATSTTVPSMEEDLQELARLYQADQDVRLKKPLDSDNIKTLIEQDRQRRVRVKEWVSAGALKTANDYFHAAMIMQHGEEPEDFMLAHELATVAGFKGNKTGRWLSAASWDRLLQRLGRGQRFGTQSCRTVDKPWTMEPLDTGLPDSVRREYDVPTLEESRRRLEERNRK